MYINVLIKKMLDEFGQDIGSGGGGSNYITCSNCNKLIIEGRIVLCACCHINSMCCLCVNDTGDLDVCDHCVNNLNIKERKIF